MLSAGRSVGTNAATTSQTSTDKVSALFKGDDVMIMSMSMMILTMMRVIPNRKNLQKSSKRTLTLPLIFGKSYCNFFNFMLKEPCLKVQNLLYKSLD